MTTHSETRALPYTAEQMFDLVADVKRYPEFLPWCSAARVKSRTMVGDHEVMDADLIISFKVFRERFTSRVKLWAEEKRIETEYLDGPFRKMISVWKFNEAQAGECEVDFFVEFEFKSALLNSVVGVVFNDAMQRVVRAFERRAKELHG